MRQMDVCFPDLKQPVGFQAEASYVMIVFFWQGMSVRFPFNLRPKVKAQSF